MAIKRHFRRFRFTLACAALVGTACTPATQDDAGTASVPVFVADTTWPADLPPHWVFGPGTGIHVDDRDHAWLLHRPERITDEDMQAARDPTIPGCCEKAPPLLEIGPDGSLLATYGSIERSEDWPYFPHGVFVDHADFLWVGNAPHHTIMKLTQEGGHLFTIGEFDRTGGSYDPDLLGGAADFWVDPETDELFVADGYVNRRIVVFDAEDGSFLRQWGAYGSQPNDDFVFDSTATDLPPQFNLVHGITGADDGLVYVADATTSRLQVFTKDGTFVDETSIDGRSLPARITGVALSRDPTQRWLYVADGRDDKVWILRRADLAVVGEFGSSGAAPGQFGRPHNIATDSQGNLYVAEAHPGRRFQRFILQPATLR